MTSVTTSESPLLRAIGIRKSYLRGRQRADVLSGIDVEISRGECVFLVGPSGSGKSTLLAILGCILSPDQGEVHFQGTAVTHLSPAQRTVWRRNNIGFVFQRFHLVRGLTALENVSIPLRLQGVTESEAKQRSQKLLLEVGLADQVHADPRRMSAGQCQRVAIARALATNPDLILADEPTASLDESNGRQAMELFSSLVRGYGKTAIVVTHDPRIYSFADRILRVENGKLNESPLHDLVS